MSEKRRGRDPEKGQNLYYKAVKYPDEESSEKPYETLQDFIKQESVNLSVYRLRFGEQLDYHVAILGKPPEEGLRRLIDDTLKDGELVTIPQEILDALVSRREEQRRYGTWVERHHFPRRRRTK